ncbi:putative toxin-antitoxin system toxin component, PIN family [Parapedobacter tibetensis]|uniref:putative toxin-antitoxin system toxin component, PIN family n=1 Tax=Parapedobacter tibetensis TaxID=2972951 RepID=UPI00214DA33B|nr:putative toxin-antitoxin system toxin component, PIN family [Parapedobacter tibetensis]
MPRKRHRVIIDTNLWISYLLSPNFKKLDAILARKEINLLFSQELLDELITVTQRPKFKKYFNAKDVSSLLYQLRTRAELVNVTSIVHVCRDDKDNFLLGLAEDGKATHLITGDKDLLILQKHKKTTIVSIADYLRNH